MKCLAHDLLLNLSETITSLKGFLPQLVVLSHLIEHGDSMFYVNVSDGPSPSHCRIIRLTFGSSGLCRHGDINSDMANRIDATYVATEYLGSLETDVFEFAPNHYVHVEQHRASRNRSLSSW